MTDEPRPPDARQGRSVSLFYAGLGIALFALIAAIALVVRPPAPPSIAEFAPKATAVIKKAPPQSSKFGNGSTACSAGSSCAGPKPPPPTPLPSTPPPPARTKTTYVPSQLQCYQWPNGDVTQTFDPQSPPCIATWSGNNGGSTYRGVTGNQIVVAEADEGVNNYLNDIVHFINSHFELYGRQIRLQFYTTANTVSCTANCTSTETPGQQQADADTVINQIKAFASTNYEDNQTEDTPTFLNDLAAAHVLSVDDYTRYSTTANFNARAPYQWSYEPPLDTMETNLAQVVCHELAGRPASWAGYDQNKTRSFGLMVDDSATGASKPTTGPLLSGLSACGVRPKVAYYASQASSGDTNPQSTPTEETYVQWRRTGVTTVIPLLEHSSDVVGNMNLAGQVGYSPEWLLPGIGEQNIMGALYVGNGEGAATEARQLYGLNSWNEELPAGQTPVFQAMTQVNPADAHAAANGSLLVYRLQPFYQAMLLLASGIQEAGPHLTPQTFAAGLAKTQFPNPYAAAPPYHQATVGFPGGSHTMVQDVGLAWFSATSTQDYYFASVPGDWCYVGGGTRWREGQWPQGNPGFFDRNQPCRG